MSTYSKQASVAEVTPREWALLPPTQYNSVFTLQQANSVGTSFGSNMNRFKCPKPGSFFAITSAEPSSFKANNPHHKTKLVPSEEIPHHRPLWESELKKEVPEGARYDIVSQIGSTKTLFKSRAHTFKNNYDKYNRTCDAQKDIKIYNSNADVNTRGVASYDIERGLKATKKRVPSFT